MAKIAIVYHSGYGHTERVAQHVLKGAAEAGADASLYKADDLQNPDEGPWDKLAEADAIIFGSPTYMGSTSAVMATFLEATSKIWFTGGWENKLAAGFTNSGSLAGDKNETLHRFATLAAQQGMIWVNFGMKGEFNSTSSNFETARNRAGHYIGLGTQALTDLPADQSPDAADIETSELFGKRVAEAALRWVRGAQA